MDLIFQLPEGATHDTIRACFEVLGAVMLGRPVALQRQTHGAVRDMNTGGGECFEGTWHAEGARYEARVVAGPGDPREGLSYDVAFAITVEGPTGPASARMERASWTPVPTALFVTVEGAPVRLFPALRAAAATVPGVIDSCATATVALPIIRALLDAGHADLALALAREALGGTPKGTWGHEQLLEHVEQLAPSTGGLARQLQEAPTRLAGWLEAAMSPPDGVSAAVVAAALARLCPYDAQRWAGAGLSSPPWMAHPSWPVMPPRDEEDPRMWWTLPLPHTCATGIGSTFLRILTGAEPDEDPACEGPFEGVDGWAWHVRRRARWVEGEALPRAHVTLVAMRQDSAHASEEEIVWEWASGPTPGDAIVWAQREKTHRGVRDEAFAWTVVGTDSFASAVRGAWDQVSPYRWDAVPPATALLPRAMPEMPWCRPLCKRDPREGAAEALALGGLPDTIREQAVALLACRCPHPARGACEHGATLIALRRTQLATRADPAETVRAQARAAALTVALSAMGAAPNRLGWVQAVSGLNAAVVAVAALRENGP